MPNSKIDVEAFIKLHFSHASGDMPVRYVRELAQQYQAEIDRRDAELVTAKAKLLAPGIMRCAKCSLRINRVNLHVNHGTFSAGDSKTEPCPNGCGPLWPVTWQEYAKDVSDSFDRVWDELQSLKAALSASAGQIQLSDYEFAEHAMKYMNKHSVTSIIWGQMAALANNPNDKPQ